MSTRIVSAVSLAGVSAVLLFLAGASGGCTATRTEEGGYTLAVSPRCADTDRPPETFVLEASLWATDWWQGKARDESALATLHVERYETIARTASSIDYAVPQFYSREELRLPWNVSGLYDYARMRLAAMVVFCEGYEMERKMFNRSGSHTAWTPTLVRWSNSTDGFGEFWRGLGDVGMFARWLIAWREAVSDPARQPAAIRLGKWFVRRYEAAVAEDPRLATDRAASEHVESIRECVFKYGEH